MAGGRKHERIKRAMSRAIVRLRRFGSSILESFIISCNDRDHSGKSTHRFFESTHRFSDHAHEYQGMAPGWTKGMRFENSDLRFEKNPHPSPPPGYRERGE